MYAAASIFAIAVAVTFCDDKGEPVFDGLWYTLIFFPFTFLYFRVAEH